VKQKPIKTIIITGTHLTPALELIRQLKADTKNNWQIHYLGRYSNSNDSQNTSIESAIIPKNKVSFHPIHCGKFDRRFLPNTIAGIPKIILGFFESQKIIKKIKPNIIVSFGGYVSVPVIINAWIKKIPSITHEQTLTNSLTTKINNLFVTKVALSFNNPKQITQLNSKKIVVTGNLLRYQLFNKNISKPNKSFSDKKPIIYITAGNQGSHHINLIVKKILPVLSKFQVIHQTGKNDFFKFEKLEKKYPFYLAFDYVETETTSWILNHSQIIISRSGANTSQEIVALNKKSILIPLLKSQQNEQILNANWVKDQLPQSTIIINQENLNQNILLKSIETLNNLSSPKQKNKPQANLKLLQLIHEII